jgi:hypothetical protein
MRQFNAETVRTQSMNATTATKKTRFDYRAACTEVALPIARALPESVLALYRELRDAPEFDKLAQGRDLDVPMPEGLAPRFAVLPSAVLALAAQALYSAWHWGGSSHSIDEGKPDTRGATWKFSNLADQELRRRLGLGSHSAHKANGYHYAVIEGALRVCAQTPDSWTWLEVGPATLETLALAQAHVLTLPLGPCESQRHRSSAWAAFETGAYEFTRQRPACFELSEDWRRLLDAGRDYTREEGKCSDDCPECGTSQLWRKGSLCNHASTCSHYPIAPAVERAREALALVVKQADQRGIDSGPAKLAAQALDFYTSK